MPVDIRQMLASEPAKVGKILFLAVDGHGGSGKSTLAKWLAGKLKASVVQTDDFASWDNPLHWWPLVIERVFEPILNGATALHYPRSKWWENHHPEPVIEQPVTSMMILEGVSSSRKEFRDYISLSIFVDTPKEICLQRGLERDSGHGSGRTKEELAGMWNGWFKKEDEYMRRDRPKEHAHLVVDGTKPFEEQVSVA